MKLTSSAFKQGGTIPSQYTCDGDNINPPLEFHDVPSETKSLVLIMDDPDVPKSLRPDGMYDHWIVFNIPPNTTVIQENEEPNGVHGLGTGKTLKYYGPCPPDREHRYFFKLYALDTLLSLEEEASKKDVEEAMQNHILAEAQLMGLYDRKK